MLVPGRRQNHWKNPHVGSVTDSHHIKSNLPATKVGRSGVKDDEAELFDNSKVSEWLTASEAALYLRISVGSLRNLTCSGQIPFYKLFGRNRYRLEDLRSLHLKNEKGGI